MIKTAAAVALAAAFIGLAVYLVYGGIVEMEVAHHKAARHAPYATEITSDVSALIPKQAGRIILCVPSELNHFIFVPSARSGEIALIRIVEWIV